MTMLLSQFALVLFLVACLFCSALSEATPEGNIDRKGADLASDNDDFVDGKDYQKFKVVQRNERNKQKQKKMKEQKAKKQKKAKESKSGKPKPTPGASMKAMQDKFQQAQESIKNRIAKARSHVNNQYAQALDRVREAKDKFNDLKAQFANQATNLKNAKGKALGHAKKLAKHFMGKGKGKGKPREYTLSRQAHMFHRPRPRNHWWKAWIPGKSRKCREYGEEGTKSCENGEEGSGSDTSRSEGEEGSGEEGRTGPGEEGRSGEEGQQSGEEGQQPTGEEGQPTNGEEGRTSEEGEEGEEGERKKPCCHKRLFKTSLMQAYEGKTTQLTEFMNPYFNTPTRRAEAFQFFCSYYGACDIKDFDGKGPVYYSRKFGKAYLTVTALQTSTQLFNQLYGLDIQGSVLEAFAEGQLPITNIEIVDTYYELKFHEPHVTFAWERQSLANAMTVEERDLFFSKPRNRKCFYNRYSSDCQDYNPKNASVLCKELTYNKPPKHFAPGTRARFGSYLYRKVEACNRGQFHSDQDYAATGFLAGVDYRSEVPILDNAFDNSLSLNYALRSTSFGEGCWTDGTAKGGEGYFRSSSTSCQTVTGTSRMFLTFGGRMSPKDGLKTHCDLVEEENLCGHFDCAAKSYLQFCTSDNHIQQYQLTDVEL